MSYITLFPQFLYNLLHYAYYRYPLNICWWCQWSFNFTTCVTTGQLSTPSTNLPAAFDLAWLWSLSNFTFSENSFILLVSFIFFTTINFSFSPSPSFKRRRVCLLLLKTVGTLQACIISICDWLVTPLKTSESFSRSQICRLLWNCCTVIQLGHQYIWDLRVVYVKPQSTTL